MAVVDVSKEFYHFPTCPEECNYLGLIHPITGQHLRYKGLPMGSSSSPFAAGKGVTALLRDLTRDDMFQGRVVVNNITNHLVGGEFDPSLPLGRVVMKNGRTVPTIWAHVDDFLIVNLLLTHLIRLGLLAHPGKVKPPAQVQHFCGFEYNTRALLVIRLPRRIALPFLR